MSGVPPAEGQGLEGRILAEQVKVLHGHLLPVLAINLVVGGALIWGLWEVLPQEVLLAWGGALLAVVAARALAYLRYVRFPDRGASGRAALALAVGSGLSGLTWGVGGVALFDPASLEHQLFILCVLVGMGAGAVSSLTAYYPAFAAYFPVSLLPIAGMLLAHGGALQAALGVMTLAYVAGLSFFGFHINRSLAQAWRLRFENMDLVQELSVQKRAAERADAAKSHFLAAASHDLRQPLHALNLFVGALDERIRYPEVRRIVDNVKSSTRALEELLNALLDMSRLDAGVLRADVRDFDLEPVLERIRHDFGPSAREKGLAFHCPSCAAGLRSDPVLLEQILRNYVSNAVRHTERGEVRVHCAPAGDGVRITVADTGAGIPQGQHEAIFREFYQLGNPERDRARGLGLGLAIVARLATLLGHPIHLESAPGEGARFSVDVPRGRPRARGPEGEESPDDASDVRGLEVLVLDDDPAARESIRELLEAWGCRVLAAATEREAHERVRAGGRAPDAIVADYRLRGGETGDAAIRSLRAALGSPVPSLIVTGDMAVERPRDDAGIGLHLLRKPVQPARLRAFLRHARRTGAVQA